MSFVIDEETYCPKCKAKLPCLIDNIGMSLCMGCGSSKFAIPERYYKRKKQYD